MFLNILCLDIPCFVGIKDGGTHQLLVFCGASLVCYATAVYLRITDGSIVHTNLVFSKMRLVLTGKRKSRQFKKLLVKILLIWLLEVCQLLGLIIVHCDSMVHCGWGVIIFSGQPGICLK